MDDFFNSYVAELTNRSKRAGGERAYLFMSYYNTCLASIILLQFLTIPFSSQNLYWMPAVSTDPIAKQLRTGAAPSSFAMSELNGTLSGNLSDMNRGLQVSPSPFLGQGAITPELLQQAGLLALQQQQQQMMMNKPQPRPPGMIVPQPAYNVPPPMFGGQPAPSGLAPLGGLAMPKAQMQPQETVGMVDPPSPDGTHSGGDVSVQRHSGNEKGGRGGKNARQQEANKIAQQRYRERKKQKFHDMEKQVELLRQELANFQSVQARNQILEGMNTDLQRALVEREREVERLKVELDSQADASLGNASEDSENVAGGGTGTTLRQSGSREAHHAGAGGAVGSGGGDPAAMQLPRNMSVPCDMLPRNLSGIDFEAGFSQQIELLQKFMKQHNLESTDVSLESVSDDVIADLAQLVGTSCQLCQAAIRAEGARVLELIAGDPSQLSSAEHPQEERFITALEAMQLSPQQEEQLLLLRKSHLSKMREIYAERQELNLEAMALMLPHHSRNPAEDNTLEGKMENISNFGYLPVAKSNAELAKVLDAIKDNLRREQRSAMDINCATVSRVLNPLQAAHYMVSVFPQHCDALALSNVLAHRLGSEPPSNGGSRVNSRVNSENLAAALCGAPATCCP